MSGEIRSLVWLENAAYVGRGQLRLAPGWGAWILGHKVEAFRWGLLSRKSDIINLGLDNFFGQVECHVGDSGANKDSKMNPR